MNDSKSSDPIVEDIMEYEAMQRLREEALNDVRHVERVDITTAEDAPVKRIITVRRG